ncbi:hypothetical protein LTR29_006035 [Friedmanniomyces endolithicus]|nr:hypothetical protein LTR29_006035 [Friedmanniomyces endolithicus]
MPTNEKAGFSARDFELLAGAMSCSKTVIEVDYVKYAEMFGFKNPGSGKATWNALKRKLKRMGEGDGAGGETSEEPGGVKRKAEDEGIVEEAEDEMSAGEAESSAKKTFGKSPAKKGRKTEADPKGKNNVAVEDGDEDMPVGNLKGKSGTVKAEE